MRRGANGTSETFNLEIQPFPDTIHQSRCLDRSMGHIGDHVSMSSVCEFEERKGRKDAVCRCSSTLPIIVHATFLGSVPFVSRFGTSKSLALSWFTPILPAFWPYFTSILPYFTRILWQIHGDLSSSVLPIFSFAAIPFLGTPNSRAALPRDSENQPGLSCKKPREHTWNTVLETLFWTL